jgi:hypothetical protein
MRSIAKNVHKPKMSKNAKNSFGAITTREREKGKSRAVAKDRRDSDIESEDEEAEADVLQHPIHRRAVVRDVIPTHKRKLRGVLDNESPSDRGRSKHATGPSVAPRRSDRHKVLSNSAPVPQDDDTSGEMESQVRHLYMLH